MNGSQVWAMAAALFVLGLSAGWFARRLYSLAEVRRLMERLLLLDNELRSARAALIRERQLRLGAQTALREQEQLRQSSRAEPQGEPEAQGDDTGNELEELMIEVDEGQPEAAPLSVSLARFAPPPGVYSEPPPRRSDVRELRRERSSDEITRRAYQLWDAAGRPSGQDEHFWYMAERALREEAAADDWQQAAAL